MFSLFHRVPSVLDRGKNFGERFRAQIKLYIWQDRFNRIFFLISVTFATLHLALIVFPGLLLRRGRELIALRYNIYFGVDILQNWNALFIYVLFASLVIVVNFGTSLLFRRREKLLSSFIIAITPVLLFINLLTLIFVLALNLEFVAP